jgi:hypothetical protein
MPTNFPPIVATVVYAGYRPTTQEIQAPVNCDVIVRIVQTSKWKYRAYFGRSRPRVPVNGKDGQPISGDIDDVMRALAERFERVKRLPVWTTYKGELVPYEPTPRPEAKRPKKARPQ